MDILREGVKKQPRNSFVSPPVPSQVPQPTLSSQLENLTMSHLTKRHSHKRVQALEKMEDITLDLLWERREDPWW